MFGQREVVHPPECKKLSNAAADFSSKDDSDSSSRAVVGPTSLSSSITPGSSELISGNGASFPRRP